MSRLLLMVLIIYLHGLYSWGSVMAAEKLPDIQSDNVWQGAVDLAAGDNPATLAIAGEVRYRHVYRFDKSPMWDGLYTQGGFHFNVTPAFGRAGVHGEWLPIAILQLRLQYDHYKFFGRYGSLLSYVSGDELFDDDVIKIRKGEEKQVQQTEYYCSRRFG